MFGLRKRLSVETDYRLKGEGHLGGFGNTSVSWGKENVYSWQGYHACQRKSSMDSGQFRKQAKICLELVFTLKW